MKQYFVLASCSILSLFFASNSFAESARSAQAALTSVKSVTENMSISAPEVAPQFKIVVRAVGGEGERVDGPTFDPSINDSRIEDLRVKLKRFPFASYHLITTNEVTVDLMKRGKVQLSNGHTLCLRPLTSDGDQMTLWMKWNGEDDMSILNTRLNFAINEPMIVGYEGQDSTGLILAVQVVPQ